jgi:hypothetical protein
MKIEHDVRYQRIGEGLAATPAFQKPFRHRLKIPQFSTKGYATESFQSKIYSPTRCQVAVIRLDLSVAFVLIVLMRVHEAAAQHRREKARKTLGEDKAKMIISRSE